MRWATTWRIVHAWHRLWVSHSSGLSPSTVAANSSRSAAMASQCSMTGSYPGQRNHMPTPAGAFVEKAPALPAEGVGFEPTVPNGHNGFRDRPIRPLSHPS
jgi:hypothetical protein